jgi:hypothetical protein
MNPGRYLRRARRSIKKIWKSDWPQAVLMVAAVLAAVIAALMLPT